MRCVQPWHFLSIVLLAASTTVQAQTTAGDFALRDGDTVVFFGDSNTELGSYPRDVENYTLLRYPERRIRFVNAGIGGDMASKAFFRLERDVFGEGARATVVFVLFGINDISWGNYSGPQFRKTFVDYTLRIVDACRKRNVRVYVLSYPITAAPVGDRARDPFLSFVAGLSATDTSLLQRLGDETMALARAHGAATIDVEREMRRIQAATPSGTRFHRDDGVHLNEFGNQALAFALLKGLGAPAVVSSVRIDAARGQVLASDGAVVSGLKGTAATTLEFTRLDRGLPLTFSSPADSSGTSMEKIFEPVNGYFLSFNGLPPGTRFQLQVDGRLLSPKCGFTAGKLLKGLNLAAVRSNRWRPRGPWAEQAIALGRITEGKADLYRAFFYPGENELRTQNWELMRSRINPALERASEAQQAIAKPRAYHYSVTALPADSTALCSATR